MLSDEEIAAAAAAVRRADVCRGRTIEQRTAVARQAVAEGRRKTEVARLMKLTRARVAQITATSVDRTRTGDAR